MRNKVVISSVKFDILRASANHSRCNPGFPVANLSEGKIARNYSPLASSKSRLPIIEKHIQLRKPPPARALMLGTNIIESEKKFVFEGEDTVWILMEFLDHISPASERAFMAQDLTLFKIRFALKIIREESKDSFGDHSLPEAAGSENREPVRISAAHGIASHLIGQGRDLLKARRAPRIKPHQMERSDWL